MTAHCYPLCRGYHPVTNWTHCCQDKVKIIKAQIVYFFIKIKAFISQLVLIYCHEKCKSFLLLGVAASFDALLGPGIPFLCGHIGHICSTVCNVNLACLVLDFDRAFCYCFCCFCFLCFCFCCFCFYWRRLCFCFSVYEGCFCFYCCFRCWCCCFCYCLCLRLWLRFLLHGCSSTFSKLRRSRGDVLSSNVRILLSFMKG